MNRRTQESAQKETRALALRAQGKRLDEIAEELGYADASGAHRAIGRGLEKHRAASVDEYRALAWAQLDELDAQAATITAMPGVGATDLLRAIETRRKIVQTRGEVLGIKHAHTAPQGPGTGGDTMPDAGAGSITVVSLNDAPVDVLPEDLEAVGVVPEGVFVVGIDPDWQPERLAYVFGRDGLLLRGNVLFRAEDLGPWLRWRREQLDLRRREVEAASDVVIVDP